MSKNILILSGSPRKGGNSDILCDRFMEGARESGHRAEKVFLRDKNIGYCIGCEACHQNNGVCVQKDDMAEILGKMIAADVIVMATPVYFYTMDAQMKTLIDRCVARYTEISNKAFYFIATAADGEKRSLERTDIVLYILCNFKFLVLRNIVFVNLQLFKVIYRASAVIRQPLSAVILYGVRILTPRCFKRFIGVIAKHCITCNCPVAVTFIMLI